MNPFKYLAPQPRLVGYVSGLALNLSTGDRYALAADANLQAFAGHLATSQTIKAGFRTDYASVPRWARWAIPKAHNDYGHATLVHDWLYSHHTECAEMAQALGYSDARLFADQLMLVMGSHKSWRMPVMYWALRWFGGKYWSEYDDQQA